MHVLRRQTDRQTTKTERPYRQKDLPQAEAAGLHAATARACRWRLEEVLDQVGVERLVAQAVKEFDDGLQCLAVLQVGVERRHGTDSCVVSQRCAKNNLRKPYVAPIPVSFTVHTCQSESAAQKRETESVWGCQKVGLDMAHAHTTHDCQRANYWRTTRHTSHDTKGGGRDIISKYSVTISGALEKSLAPNS